MHMKSPFRLLVVAGVVAMSGANPSTLRPICQLLANPTASMQRAETLAQWAMRVDNLKTLFRRP
jgi:hypothetical protein